MPFEFLYQGNRGAINPESNFTNYWHSLRNFEYNQHTFTNIATIAFRLNAIPLSEAGAERAFSQLKHRFPDRRNRASHDTGWSKSPVV